MTAPNPFAERSATNPTGALRREAVVTIRRAETRDGMADPAAEAPSTIELALSSEAPVERYDWMTGERYVEVLDHGPNGIDLSYAADGLPFCMDHDLDDQIGLVEDLSVDRDRVLRGVVRRGNHPDASWLFADMAAGIRKKVSIGYWPGDVYTQTKDKNGVVTRRYTGWTLYECSSVTVPADYSVGVGRSASGAAPISLAGTPADSTEQTMTVDTQSERGAAPAPDIRPQELAALARNFPAHARLAEWISENVTVDTARDEVMRKLAAAAEQRAPNNPTQPAVTQQHERAEDKPWRDGAEFISAVIRGTQRPHEMDVRLKADAARSQNTNVGADGGFAVPAPVQTMLLEASKTGGEILSRVTERPITTGNGIKETVVKEEARTDGSRNGGIRHYWVAEEGDITTSQAKLREIELGLKKIATAVPITEEQMEDGPALVSFLQEQVPEEMRFGKELAIWSGNGSGKPLGFMNSGAVISVAIESTQTIANTADFIWKNAANMMVRMNPTAFLRSAWFINQSLWAKIVTATAGASSSGAVTVFTPPGRLPDAPMGAIYGRPIVPVEYASAEGTVGDFVLADFKDYIFAQKGGMRFAQSMHVEFLKDKQVLKFVERVDGQPRTRVPLTPLNGSATTSPYVYLASRS